MIESNPSIPRPIDQPDRYTLHLSDSIIGSLSAGVVPQEAVLVHREELSGLCTYQLDLRCIHPPRLDQSVEFCVNVGKYQIDIDQGFPMYRLVFIYSLDGQGQIANVQLTRKAPQAFELTHRWVEPDYRRAGLATSLLHQAESCIRQLVDLTGLDYQLLLYCSQRDVLQWGLQRGFEPISTHQQLVDDIIRNPNQFQMKSSRDQRDGVTKHEVIFPVKKMVNEHTPFSQAVRVCLEKWYTMKKD